MAGILEYRPEQGSLSEHRNLIEKRWADARAEYAHELTKDLGPKANRAALERLESSRRRYKESLRNLPQDSKNEVPTADAH